MAWKSVAIISALLSALPGSVADPKNPEHGKATLGHLAKPMNDWWQRFKQQTHEAVSPKMDMVTLDDIISDGKGVWAETCNSNDDAMQVDAVHFDSQTLTLHAHGQLLREITGGTVMANISLGAAPAGSTLGDKFKRTAAFMAVGRHNVQEGLCQHLARANNGSSLCPLAAGYQELRFSFDRLPQVVAAGKYTLRVKVIDEMGSPVACAHGGLDIPRGPKGELFRRMQEPVAASGVRALKPPVVFGLLASAAAAFAL